MSYREVSEIRDGMRIDWDMPIEMDDGLVLRCDIYRPIKAGRYPVIMTYGPYGKWLHFDDLYSEQWRRMCEIRPDVPTGSTNKYQCWEVVDPEKWVPDNYVVHPRRQPRRRPLAGRDRHLVAARGAGSRAMRRMGRRAAVVERQGRIERHLLLRREPVAVRGAAAQAPRRDLPLGGRRRFLPRHGAPRRHLLQRLHQGLVGEPGLYAAARPRHARLPQPHDRRLGVGAAGADRRRARRQPPQLLRGLPRAKARHRRLLAVAHAGLVEGQGAAVLGGELGRPGPASARQFRGIRPRRLEAEMAGEPRPRALDAFLHGLWRRAAEEVLRPFPQGREDRLGQAAQGAAAGASRRQVRRAAREGMAAQAHQVDQDVPRPGGFLAVDQAARRRNRR